MLDTMQSLFASFLDAAWRQFRGILNAPFNDDHRLYWPYLLASVLIALLVFLKHRSDADRERSFLAFLFPKKVWGKASAWLDLRFFVVNEIFGKLVFVGLLAASLTTVFGLVSGEPNPPSPTADGGLPTMAGMGYSLGYMLIAAIVTDFVAFYVHYLQHKVPALWEFHKVHHSPEVMHPVSNFREHPVDNVFYSVAIGASYGVVMGLASRVFGYIPTTPEILGIPVLFLLFNIAGYHLRHSHIWLRWPGRWSMVFPSPAHHHVHHSCHPDHLDKNFAFMFPVWDVLFKTYHMPETNEDVKFGLFGEDGETEYDSIPRLYYIPFRNIVARISGSEEPQPKAEVTDDNT